MDFPSMLEAVRKLPLLSIFLVVFLYGMVLVIACLRWVILLRSFGIRVSTLLSFQLMFIGLFFNNMMPSLTGGDVVKAYYTAKGTTKKFEAVASILLDRIFGVFAMIILAVVGALFTFHHDKLGSISRMILIFFVVFMLGLFIFLNLSYWKRFKWVKRIVEQSDWMEGIREFYSVMIVLKHKLGFALIALVLSVLLQGSLVLMNYILARGLGMSGISLGQFYVMIPIAGFISAMPISFAGWGVGEGAYRALFKMMNPAYGSIAVTLSIVYRLILLVYSLFGFPLYLVYRHGPIETQKS